MGWLDKLKDLILTKSEKHPPPKTFLSQPDREFTTPTQSFTPKPEPIKFTISKPHGLPKKLSVLRWTAKLMLVFNIVVAAFFTSNNMYLNAGLYAYLSLSCILLGHYLSVSR